MADTDKNVPISAPLDGQIALTAHNNGNGTWAVKRGPDGPILKDGLAREEALAIVGAPTGPHEPDTVEEETAAQKRSALEKKEAKREATEIFQSDAEAGEPSKVANSDLQKANDENADLRRSIASKDEEIRQLQDQVAKFDPDGDGKVGGGATKAVSKTAGEGPSKPKNGDA
jgi:hypothetical protein